MICGNSSRRWNCDCCSEVADTKEDEDELEADVEGDRSGVDVSLNGGLGGKKPALLRPKKERLKLL